MSLSVVSCRVAGLELKVIEEKTLFYPKQSEEYQAIMAAKSQGGVQLVAPAPEMRPGSNMSMAISKSSSAKRRDDKRV